MLPGLIDLASELVGGVALAASDDFFAPKENLLKASAPIFVPDKYTDRGKWMDGWESRRKRTPGHDWCVVRLGLPGASRASMWTPRIFWEIFPRIARWTWPAASATRDSDWNPALGRCAWKAAASNIFDIEHPGRVTHVRLNIFPDGGVARLRVYGEVVPDLAKLKASPDPVDLASDRERRARPRGQRRILRLPCKI